MSTKRYTKTGNTANEVEEAYNNCFKITAKDSNTPLLSVPENATVIIEDMVLEGGDIEIGKNAKLYLNNIKFTGETRYKDIEDEDDNIITVIDGPKIHVSEGAILILGGDTIINNDSSNTSDTGEDTTSFVSLDEGGKIQLGMGRIKEDGKNVTTPAKLYNPQKLVLLQTKDKKPKLNVILLESEDGTTLEQSFRAVYNDLVVEDVNLAYKLFRLDDVHSPGYYIGYAGNDNDKPGSETYGRGLVKIPAAYIVEPIVGGYTVKLISNGKQIDADTTGRYGNNIYVISKGTKLTYSVYHSGSDLIALNSSSTNKIKNLKLELYLEGDIIEQSNSNNELTIPSSWADGYYTLYAYFTYDGISYCEHFLVYITGGNQ